MINKILFSSSILFLSLLSISNVSFSNDLKTSSLAIVKTEKTEKLPSQCQQMFSEGDKLISEVEKQPGTHTQVAKLKDKLNSSKQQILQLTPANQELSCEKGLLALNNLKNKLR